MNKGILAAVALGIALLLSSGCPELGIEVPKTNTLVIHNLATSEGQEQNITHLSVVLVPDECSDDRPSGINLLPETLPYGGTFSIEGLSDGRYWCSTDEGIGYVTLSGGNTTDWYVR